jgi:hypothetical protein
VVKATSNPRTSRAAEVVRGDRNGPRLLSLVKVCLLAMPPYVAGPHPRADKLFPATSATASAANFAGAAIDHPWETDYGTDQ